MAETVEKIVYNYTQRGLPQITREVQKHNIFLRQTQTIMQQYSYTQNKWIKQTSTITRGISGLNKGMAGLALRFVGYNLVLNQIMGAQQRVLEFVKESITTFRDFENAVAEVSTILDGVSMQQLPSLRAGMEGLSVTFGKSATDMARATYQILSAAFDATESMNLLTIATKASVAGLSTVEESVDILTSVLNAYGKTVSQAARISDYLFQTVVRGKLRFEDFNNALGYITPIAANAGIAFKEIAAVMSTTTRMGLHADMTVRGLALGMQGLINPTEQVIKAAKKYNIEIGALELRTNGLTGIINQLHDASEEYGTHIIGELIPNMRSLRVFSAIAGDEGIAGLTTDMDLLTESAGKTEEAMAKIIKTTKFMADQLSQAMEQIKRDWGASMTMVSLNWDRLVQGMMGGMSTMVTSSRKMGDEWYDWIPIFGQLALGWERFTEGADESNQRIRDIFEATGEYIRNTLKAQYAETGKKSLYEMLIGEGADINKVIKDMQLLEDIEIRIGIKGNIEERVNELNDFTVALEDSFIKGTITAGEYIERLTNITQKYGITLRTLDTELLLTESSWNDLNDAIASFEEAQDNTQKNIDQIIIALGNWKDEVGEVDKEYDGLLGIELEHKEAVATLEDQIRALQRAMKGQEADLHLVSDAMKDHIAKINEQREAYDALTKAASKNRLEIMKLELKGMIRRRGLLRAEQRTIKKFQIENKKIAIEQLGMKIDEEESAQQTSKEIIDDELQHLRDKLWEMKDTRWEDISNLRDTITEKESEITRWTDILSTQQSELVTLTQTHTQLMVSLYTNMTDDILKEFERLSGYDVTGFVQENVPAIGRAEAAPVTQLAKALPETSPIRQTVERMQRRFNIPTFHGGIDYVPETMPAIVQRGERIIPANQNTSVNSGINIGTVIIQVKEIADISSIEKLNDLLAESERTGLMKRGKTSFGVR